MSDASLMQQQIAIMLDMQDSMNEKVHPQWRHQGYAWYRAVWVECAELMDHQGYKWWKRHEPDNNQVLLEIVDIWHFGMSMMLETTNSDGLASAIADGFAERTDLPQGVLEATEELVLRVLRERRFPVDAFHALMEAADMTFPELFRHYVGKNVLNRFRQDHGYKQGAYRKHWLGREDNVHLTELVASLDDQSADFPEQLYEALQQRYYSESA